MTDSFLRQRRNLFIVNGILLFAFLAKVEISKLTFAGISFSGFGNATSVYHFLWVMMGYFFYRFSVFFIEDEKKAFTNFWVRELSARVDEKLKNIVSKSNAELNEASIHGYYQMKANNWHMNYQVYTEDDELREKVLENIKLPISRKQVIAPQCIAIIRFCLLTPALTNYVLPIVFSFFVLYFVGFSSWEGALVTFFT